MVVVLNRKLSSIRYHLSNCELFDDEFIYVINREIGQAMCDGVH